MVSTQKDLGEFAIGNYPFMINGIVTDQYVKDHPGCYWDVKEIPEIQY